MGACESIEQKEVRQQTAYSKMIDKELQPKNEMKRKLLLLGPGESGKSTCLKQMNLAEEVHASWELHKIFRILHHNGFTEAEVLEKRQLIYQNTVEGMTMLLVIMEAKGIVYSNPENATNAQIVKKISTETMPGITDELHGALKVLWADEGVKKAFDYRDEYHLTESAGYFMNELDRVCRKDFRPTSQDILHTRTATTGVVQVLFTVKNIKFEVFDVGGQRSERRKWIHCFDDCNAVIYVAAVSEYDQVIREDNHTNRLKEAIELFSGVVNSSYFAHCSIILFLNKMDIFKSKVSKIPLSTCFEDYKGLHELEPAIEFVRMKFMEKVKNKRIPYVHKTCATDTNQVQVVINSVIDTIVQENLKDTGMI